MSTTVARIYESYGNALEASNHLKTSRFHADEIDLISKATNRPEGETADLPGEISKAGIPKGDVASYVEAVEAGKSLLVVRAAWGAAQRALRTVDSHGPAEADAGNREYYVSTVEPFSLSSFFSNLGFSMSSSSVSSNTVLSSEAAPFSKMFNWPVLINNASPLSTMFNMPTLSKGFTFGVPKLSNDFTFGVPKLLNSGTVFSDKLNMPVLSKDESKK